MSTLVETETAEVVWWYAQTLDPYGVYPDLPPEHQQVGREYFARAPGSEIWVSFDDLPREVVERLWKLHRSKLAFPAGLFDNVPLEILYKLFGATGGLAEQPRSLR